jgi:hypothetical protein
MIYQHIRWPGGGCQGRHAALNEGVHKAPQTFAIVAAIWVGGQPAIMVGDGQ